MNSGMNQRVLLVPFVLCVVLLCFYLPSYSSSNSIHRITNEELPPLLPSTNDLKLPPSSFPGESKASPHGSKPFPLPSSPSPSPYNSQVSLSHTNCTAQISGTNDLPMCVMDQIKTFVYFVGIGRSGHSIVGSLMDSHPHMVLAHEFDLFNRLANHEKLSFAKSVIFNRLWKNSKETLINHGLRAKSTNGKGYTLFIEDLYQGRYVNYIDVIGDKKGSRTTEILASKPDKWLHIYNTLKSYVTNIKGIHVIRNPYDNIATLAFFFAAVKNSNAHFGNIKKSNETFKFKSKLVGGIINLYFMHQRAIADGIKAYSLDIIEIHHKDLISDPRGTLMRLCNSLGVTCSNKYLQICSDKIYKTESKTRHLIEWTDEQLKVIQQNIDKYSSLKGYTFDSL